MAGTADGGGYWEVDEAGDVANFGDALCSGSLTGSPLAAPIVGMAATTDDGGYWLVGADGGVFAFGDARYRGSSGGIHLDQPVVGMAATADGGGYWLVASDGGVFSFGDARFLGSTGGIHLDRPVVGMASTPSGHGYWLVASDGGVFSFGDAQFRGSTGAVHLTEPVVGMAATTSGRGYWLVASDGGIFAFGDARFYGSTGGIRLDQPVVGMAATPDGGGYWLVAGDGGIFTFGDAPYEGRTSAGAPPASGFSLTAFSAVSATQWWVLGTVPCGSGTCTSVATTTDGGRTFTTLPAPGGPAPGGQLVSEIHFANSDDGWAYGPDLYATTDGGHVWTQVSLPGAVDELASGADSVFAVVDPPTPPCSLTGTCTPASPQPVLWRSPIATDGWQALPSAGAVSIDLAVFGQSVWIIDGATSRDGPVIGYHLLHSANDGTTFASEGLTDGISCDYSPLSTAVIWSYCSGGHFMVTYLSDDAGTTFQPVGPEGGLGSMTTPNGYPNGSALAAASPTTAVAASDLGGQPMIRTTDGGRTWVAVMPSLDASGVWDPIGFTTPDIGYAVFAPSIDTPHTGRLWRTTDAGASWQQVDALP